MFRGKVAAVSYLNTVPFIYGLEHAGFLRAGLILSPPSHNVASFASGDADIALLPVGALPETKNAEIVTSYCLGASNPVRTVVVMSDSPIENVRRIMLDAHSRTSVLLVKILADELWHIAPEWVDMQDYAVVEKPQQGDAFLFIGDKVFDYEGRFRYSYDLAEAWEQMTGLPFVFAVWIARPEVTQETIDALEASLAYGVKHIPEAIAWYGHSGKPYAREYLTKNIDYIFDDQKHKALSLYWEKGQRFVPRVEPG